MPREPPAQTSAGPAASLRRGDKYRSQQMYLQQLFRRAIADGMKADEVDRAILWEALPPAEAEQLRIALEGPEADRKNLIAAQELLNLWATELDAEPPPAPAAGDKPDQVPPPRNLRQRSTNEGRRKRV